MAYLSAIQPLQTHFGGVASLEAMDINPNYGMPAYMAMHTNKCPLITPDLEAAFSAYGTGQSFSIPTLKDTPIGSTTVESFDVPLNLAEGAKMDLSVVTIATGFQIPENGAFNAEIKDNVVLQDRLDAVDSEFAKKFEQYSIAYLDANKNQVALTLNGVDGLTFNTATDLMSATKALQEGIFYTAKESAFAQNGKRAQRYLDIVSASFEPAVGAYVAQYGVNNSKNLQNQISRTEYFYSDEITNSVRFTGYTVREGEIGVMHTIDPTFSNPASSVGSWEFGVLPTGMKQYPFKTMVFTDRTLADNSGLNGHTAAGIGHMGIMRKYVFVTKFAYVKKYNSDLATKVSGIIKYNGLTS